jgi:predicted transcriptional regulator
MKTNELRNLNIINVEVVEKKELTGDVPGSKYIEETRIYTLKDGRKFKDIIYDAPWQVGGNSGAVRKLQEVD